MMLKTEGSIQAARSGIRWAGGGTDTASMHLPESTQVAILKRLDRLSATSTGPQSCERYWESI